MIHLLLTLLQTAAPIELPLKPYFGSLVTVSGRIGAHEASFLFDTGGGATILSVATAKAVNCTPFGRATGFTHDGTRIDGPRGGPIDLELGAYRRHGEIGILDLDAMFQGLPPLGGIVSLETFSTSAITLDLAGKRLIVETPTSLAARTKEASELRVRPERQAAGATLDLYVAVEGVHGPQWFEMDSGNTAPVLVAPHAFVELGLQPPAAGATVEGKLTLPGLGPVACTIQSKEMIYDGLLNAAFFERHVVTMDLAAGRAWARAVPAAKR